MSEEFEVLRIVTGRLDAEAIPYMMTGSMAVNYYGVPRMTRDIDVVVELCNLLRSAPEVDRSYVEQSTTRLGLGALYGEVSR